MKGNYYLNEKTGKYHIKGYCQFTKGINIDYKVFSTEDEVLAYGGNSVCICKICNNEREKKIKESIN